MDNLKLGNHEIGNKQAGKPQRELNRKKKKILEIHFSFVFSVENTWII